MNKFTKLYESKEGTKYIIHFMYCESELRMSFEAYEICDTQDEIIYYLHWKNFSPTRDIKEAQLFLDGLIMWRGDWECKCHFPNENEYVDYELPNIVEVYDYAKNICISYKPLLKEISFNGEYK